MNAEPVPALPEDTRLQFKINVAFPNPNGQPGSKLVSGNGICIQSSRADFAIVTDLFSTLPWTVRQEI